MSGPDDVAGPPHAGAVATARQGGVHLVRLAGEIDLANADQTGERVAAETGEARAVLLDLSAVAFLDSSGVRLLDRLVGEYEDRGVPVRILATPDGPVMLILRLCGFREDLVVTDSAGALATLGG